MVNEKPDDEVDQDGNDGEDTSSPESELLDTSQIRIRMEQPIVQTLMGRLRESELQLNPSFQRKGNIWSDKNQSRLIESILIGIPLPAFYFDATVPIEEEANRLKPRMKWIVVDGLQRLTALARFILEPPDLKRFGLTQLVLNDLEFLKDLNGKSFADPKDSKSALKSSYQRRINEATITAYFIEEGTPAPLKFKMFKRINTGGLPLSQQEIRHAMNQDGKAPEFLATLAESKEFLEATAGGVNGSRMADRECVLRVLAFTRREPASYGPQDAKDFDNFLSTQMKEIGLAPDKERKAMQATFLRAMQAALAVFGDEAFRKPRAPGGRAKPVNKALMEVWSVNLGKLDDAALARAKTKKAEIKKAFATLMKNSDFRDAISQGTGDVRKVHLRFQRIAALITQVIK